MNQPDLLLAWASEKGSGSWHNWRQASESLGLHPVVSARNLSALGHVEFDWIGNQFCCAPPTAVLIPRSSGSVIVTGARPCALRGHLQALSDDDRAPYDVYFHQPLAQAEGPETWLVEADMDDVLAFCETSGLTFEVEAGRYIAELSPIATLENAAEPDEPDDRYPMEWLDPTTGIMTTGSGKATEEGLWFVSEWRRKTAFVRRRGEWFRVPVREYGIYLAYPKVVFLHHRYEQSVLEVDNRAPLPPLLARAATLQSGRLPLRDKGTHRYLNVDRELALVIANRLQTRLDQLP